MPIKEGDTTYTIELDNADLVAVGGIFTHAKMTANAPLPVIKHDRSREAALKTKNSDNLHTDISSVQKENAEAIKNLAASKTPRSTPR